MKLFNYIRSAFSGNEVSMWRRLAIRSVVMLMLTAAAMYAMDLLVMMTRARESDWVERWPEIINILRAGFIMTWIEVSILWIRATIAPKVDTQAIMIKAAETPNGAAVVSLVTTLQWMFRFVVFLLLSELAK